MRVLFLLVLCYKLFAVELIDIKKVIKVDNVESDFIQEKILKDFDMKIISKGSIKIANNKLFYTLKEPFYQEVLISNDGIFNKINDNWIKTDNEFDKEVFLDLLKLDIEKLKNKFNYDIEKQSSGYLIKLKPNNLIISKIFNEIIIEIDNTIKSILIIEKNGDTTLNKYYTNE